MTATATKWTHKVYREARDGQGKWLRLPGKATTFASEADAIEYAAAAAARLAGTVYGHRLMVASRTAGRLTAYPI